MDDSQSCPEVPAQDSQHAQQEADGNDLKDIAAANAETGKTSLIAVRTIIGYDSPKAGSAKSHGEPLRTANVAATKKLFGFTRNTASVGEHEPTDEFIEHLLTHRGSPIDGSG